MKRPLLDKTHLHAIILSVRPRTSQSAPPRSPSFPLIAAFAVCAADPRQLRSQGTIPAVPGGGGLPPSGVAALAHGCS